MLQLKTSGCTKRVTCLVRELSLQTALIRHVSSQKCLGITAYNTTKLTVETCDDTEDTQRWKFGEDTPQF